MKRRRGWRGRGSSTKMVFVESQVVLVYSGKGEEEERLGRCKRLSLERVRPCTRWYHRQERFPACSPRPRRRRSSPGRWPSPCPSVPRPRLAGSPPRGNSRRHISTAALKTPQKSRLDFSSVFFRGLVRFLRSSVCLITTWLRVEGNQ